MTVDQQVVRIVAAVLGTSPGEVEGATPLRDWSQLATINDETCMALNINIGTMVAGQCRTVGEYVTLVRTICG